MLGTCFKALGVTAVYAMQLHDPLVIGTFPVPLYDITLESVWANVIKQQIIKNEIESSWCIASPDQGGLERAQRVADLCGLPVVSIQKTRMQQDAPVVHDLQGDVEGKHVILIDDIVDTAGTLSKAAELLISKGAESVRAFCTHPVLSGKAFEKVDSSKLTELIVTDTIPLRGHSDKIKVLSSAELFASVIRRVYEYSSISPLFIKI